MIKYALPTFLLLTLVLSFTSLGYAHCEIPCGIYDDHLRIKLIAEHLTTVEKSMNRILALQKEKRSTTTSSYGGSPTRSPMPPKFSTSFPSIL